MSPFPPNTRLSLWYDWARTLGAADPSDFQARVAPLTPAHWTEFWPFVIAHGLAPWFYAQFRNQNSEFRIQNSEFNIQNSTFNIQHSQFPSFPTSDLRPLTSVPPSSPTSDLRLQTSDPPPSTSHLPLATSAPPPTHHSLLTTHHSPLTTLLPRLKQHYLHNAIANIRAFHELAEILDHTNAAGLPVIVLKGAYLANCVYPDPAERVMVDIDLLVHPSDLPAMQSIMTTLGYMADENAANNIIHISYHHAEKKHVEIHYGLWRNMPLQVLDDFWKRATPFQLEDRPALALAPTDAFLYLAMHAAYHHLLWRSLRSLLDLVLLTRTTWRPDSWTRVRQGAIEIGFAGKLPRLLYLAEQLLNSTFPGDRTDFETTPVDPQLLREDCHRALATVSNFEISATDGRSTQFVHFVRANNLSERWVMLRSILFPPPHTLAQTCGIPNTPRVWLYYPVYIFARLVRLFMLLIAVMPPKRRNARLAEFDAERERDAAWGSLTALEVGDQRSDSLV